MTNLLAIVPIAIAAYVATNIDNLILLTILLARYRTQTFGVVAGYTTCMLILGIVGFGASEIANFVPIRYLGFLGNGADTILVFGILFADSTPAADALVMITLAAMAVSFVIVAMYAVRHPAKSSVISQYAHRVLPFVLIFVGIYVIADTTTDTMPG